MDNTFQSMLAFCAGSLIGIGLLLAKYSYALYHQIQLRVAHLVSVAVLLIVGLLLSVALLYPETRTGIFRSLAYCVPLCGVLPVLPPFRRALRKPVLPKSKDVRRF